MNNDQVQRSGIYPDNMANNSYGAYINPSNDPKFRIPNELDYLLHDIATAKPTTGPDRILSYLVYYYPKLKNKQNVELLTDHFLKCPLFFSSIEVLDIEKMTKIIECFQFIIVSKFKVSNPTIPFHEFYSSIYDSLCNLLKYDNVSYWKVLPVLSGCISSISIRDRYNPYPSYQNVISKLDTFFIKLFADSFISLMKIDLLPDFKHSILINLLYIQEHLQNSFYKNLSIANPKILPELMGILYFSKSGLDKGSLLSLHEPYQSILKSMPLLRQLNRWAFLYEKIVRNAPQGPQLLQMISTSHDYIVSFCANISNESLCTIHRSSDKWDLVKYIFFTTIMIFEASTKILISGETKVTEPTFVIANQIQRSVFYLSYILDQIGTGGFDAYNFVFDSTTHILAEYSPQMAETLEYSLLNEIPASKPSTAIEISKLNYFLRITETLLPSLKNAFMISSLFPLIDKIFIEIPASASVEFCHSIMIKHLDLIASNMKEFSTTQEHTSHLQTIIFTYFSRVLTQFPEILSLGQASLIAQTCGRVICISTASDSTFINTLIDIVCFQIALSAYTPLPPRIIHQNGDEVVISEPLTTRKAGLISILIDLLQFVETGLFLTRLDGIRTHIDSLIGDRDVYTLYDILWDKLLVINKYDCQKGQIGLDWWYDTINNQIISKL